jgi:hypothetical protein
MQRLIASGWVGRAGCERSVASTAGIIHSLVKTGLLNVGKATIPGRISSAGTFGTASAMRPPAGGCRSVRSNIGAGAAVVRPTAPTSTSEPQESRMQLHQDSVTSIPKSTRRSRPRGPKDFAHLIDHLHVVAVTTTGAMIRRASRSSCSTASPCGAPPSRTWSRSRRRTTATGRMTWQHNGAL